MKNKSDRIYGLLADNFELFMVACFLLLIVGYNAAYFSSAEEITITVTGKDTVIKSDSDGNAKHQYRIYGKKETFKNVDSWLVWKFDSSDLQRELIEGETYNVIVYGWRVPFLSMHRNITDATITRE